MAISLLKTAWGAVKGFCTGGPDGAIAGAGESMVKQEVQGATKTGIEDAEKGESQQQIQQNEQKNLDKITL